MYLCVCLCVCLLTIYSAGIRVWAWKNKTLTSKHCWADVVWPEAATAACYYSERVCACEVSVCVCASVCLMGVHLCRWTGKKHAGSRQRDVNFEARVCVSVRACVGFCTHTNTYLSCVSVIFKCVYRARASELHGPGCGLQPWRSLVCCLSPRLFGYS